MIFSEEKVARMTVGSNLELEGNEAQKKHGKCSYREMHDDCH